jgi:hypothetical protein
MFVFEDIAKLSNQAIQRVLKEVQQSDIAVALKGANEEVKSVIMSNLSKRLQEMINDDLAVMGPMRVKDVEEAQQKIVNAVRALEENGEIIVSRGDASDVSFRIDSNTSPSDDETHPSGPRGNSKSQSRNPRRPTTGSTSAAIYNNLREARRELASRLKTSCQSAERPGSRGTAKRTPRRFWPGRGRPRRFKEELTAAAENAPGEKNPRERELRI